MEIVNRNTDHGWRCSLVPVHLPHEQTRWKLGEQDPAIPVLEVNGVYHCDLTNVITSILEDDVAMSFNMTPFEQYWKSSDTEELIRVYGEAYSSPAYLDAYYEINSLPRMAGDDLERIVVPLMLWSDATQLANFGSASLWPIYLFLGNQSKYARGKPTAATCHHIAYIPKVSHF